MLISALCNTLLHQIRKRGSILKKVKQHMDELNSHSWGDCPRRLPWGPSLARAGGTGTVAKQHSENNLQVKDSENMRD